MIFICDCCQLPTNAELAAEWTDGTKELGKTCLPCHEAKGKKSTLHSGEVNPECYAELASTKSGEYGVVMKNEWAPTPNAEEVQKQLSAYSRDCLVLANSFSTVSLASGDCGTVIGFLSSPNISSLVQEEVRKHEEPIAKSQVGQVMTFAGRTIMVIS